jgi:hypothetical protein
MTDIRSKIFELIIGGNDWTNYAIEAVLQWDELDIESGLIKAKASFKLDVSEMSPLPTYRSNPTQWAKGVGVTFRCEDSNGVLIKPTMGELYILREPKPPSISNPIIDLECGCILSLRDYDVPDGDYSAVEVGVSTDREAIATNILAADNITANFTSTPYPIDYPLPKQGGSFVEQVGQLMGASGHLVYQDSDGEVVNKAIDISPSSPLLTLTVGEEESEWEPEESAETPPEKIIVAGVGYSVDTLPYTETINEVTGTIADVDSRYPNNFTDLGVISRTTVRSYAYDEATRTRKIETIIEATKVAIADGGSPIGSIEAYDLVISETKEDINYYNAEGVLIKQTCETKKTYEELNLISLYIIYVGYVNTPEPRWGLTTEKYSVSEYAYTEGYLSRLIASTWLYRKGITNYKSSTQSSADLILAEKTTSTWQPLSSRMWLYRKEEYIVRALKQKTGLFIDDDFLNNEYFQLLRNPTETYIADDGSADPPATQYLSINNLDEFTVENNVILRGLGGVALESRAMTVPITYVVSTAQAQALGELYGGIVWGRRFGWGVGMAIADELLTCSPLSVIDVTDGDKIYRLLIDGLTLAFTSNESYASFTGIEVGVASVSTPTNFIKAYEIVSAGSGSWLGDSTMAIAGTLTGNIANIIGDSLFTALGYDFLYGDSSFSGSSTFSVSGQIRGSHGTIEGRGILLANARVI